LPRGLPKLDFKLDQIKYIFVCLHFLLQIILQNKIKIHILLIYIYQDEKLVEIIFNYIQLHLEVQLYYRK